MIKFFGMGSILLATPALRLMKEAFPDARITFVSFRGNRDLLERIQSIDNILTIDRSSLLAFARDTVLTIRSVLALHADITFDLEFYSKFSTFMNGVSGAPVRVAFELPTRWRSTIVTHQVPLGRDSHVLRSFCNLLFSVTNAGGTIPSIEPPTITERDHRSLLAKIPIEGRPLIAINVNAGDTFLERRWPAERFAQLVAVLASEDDASFCFIGDVHEQEYVRAAIGKTGRTQRCIDTSGKLNIPELGALLQRCELLISSDSGPLHLAASLGIPTIGLYGPESPDFYGVRHPDAQTIYRAIPCSPCMNIYAAKQFRCPYDALCMHEISVEQVLKTVRSLFSVNA